MPNNETSNKRVSLWQILIEAAGEDVANAVRREIIITTLVICISLYIFCVIFAH